MRLVWVDTGKDDGNGERIVLVVCTDRLDLDAGLVALGYPYRWGVELFCHWLKCILGCRHRLSNKQDGVAIQIYVALIASGLVSRWMEHKPTKRMYEWLCLYFQGVVRNDEMHAYLRILGKPKIKKKSRFRSSA